jgi:8-oxo-dGTP pyrophosphatase MutT (NUDIX family)
MLDRIRSALAGAQPGQEPTMFDLAGPLSGEAKVLAEERRRPAAVLVGLRERPGGLTVLLTERSKTLRSHPGQVSFPGGRVDPGDVDLWHTAVREAEEEIGLPPADVVRLGYLQTYLTVTGFVVTPAVGLVVDSFEPTADGVEVDEVFEVPLAHLFDAANITVTYQERFGTRFRVYEYEYDGHRIWGATASMLIGMRQQILGLPAP